MAYCKRCKKEVEPELHGSKYLCPDCQKFLKVSDEEKVEPQVLVEKREEDKPTKSKEILVEREGDKKIVTMGKNIRYDASDLHMGEILINLGYAKDLNDLTRKNMKLAFSLMNMGAVGKQFNTMESNQEPDPKRTMKEIQEQEMMKAYIDGMKKGDSTDPMMTMMMMRMLENQGKGRETGDNGFMKELMQMQMIKSMSGGDNQQSSALQRELADLKHQQAMYQAIAQQQQTQQGTQMSQEFMAKMETIRADRDKEMKKIEAETQKQRDTNIQLVFDTKLSEIQTEMKRVAEEAKKKGEKADLSSFKEQFNTVKELSAMMGEREKGAGEYISETIGKAAEQIGPALMDMAKQKREQAIQQQMFPQALPQASQEVPEQPLEPLPQNPELTPSEQEMANTMEDIYIKERKKE